MPLTASRPQSPSYQLFMLVLSVATLVGVGIQAALHPPGEVERLLQWGDTLACAIFFADFLVSLRRAPDKWRYLRTWGWLDLISSIPTFDAARWGRAARIARLLRLFRGIKAAAVLTDALLTRRRQSAALAASLLLLLLIVTSSILVLVVENDPASNIKSADDAIWWSVTTITTVGYGDRFPVTSEGRVVAALLMAAGVGVFGVLSGLLASWFIEPSRTPAERDEDLEEMRALRAELAEIKAMLAQR